MKVRYNYYFITRSLIEEKVLTLKERALTFKEREGFAGWDIAKLTGYEKQILSMVLNDNKNIAGCLKELYELLTKSNDIDEQSYVKLTKALVDQKFCVEVYVEN